MTLLTPGPTPIHPRVQAALARPMRGHMDPEVLAMNQRIRQMLTQLYDPGPGAFVAALAGSGSLGMEAGIANLCQPGRKVLVLVNGTFSERIADIAQVYRLDTRIIRFPIDQPLDPAVVGQALQDDEYHLVAMVHGETSTGILNPAQEIAQLVKSTGALFMLDVVTTFAMMPFSMQELGVDYAFTGSQKCLSAPPGLAPMALSQRGRAAIQQPQAWYADFNRIAVHWEKEGYHHTTPVLLHYALEEALRLAIEETPAGRLRRVNHVHQAVLSLLQELGFSGYAPPEARLPSVLAVRPPQGWNEADLRKGLYAHGVAVAGGIGPTTGQVLRLGLMGESAREEHYRVFFAALGRVMGKSGLEEAFVERLGVLA